MPQEPSGDCISKSWLKTELDKWSLEEGRKDAWDNWNREIETLSEIIDDAPSVTTEQSSMVGEWIDYGDCEYFCSNCQHRIVFEPSHLPTAKDVLLREVWMERNGIERCSNKVIRLVQKI